MDAHALEVEAALLAEMRRAPDDDAPKLVYADHLLARGDERGELVLLDHRERRGALHDPAAIARLLLLAARHGFPRLPDDPDAAILPFDHDGGGSHPVQFDVDHDGHHYYLRYRHGGFSIEVDDDFQRSYELDLDVAMENEWSFRETNAILAIVSEAIVGGRVPTLRFPDERGLRAHPAYRVGRWPRFVLPEDFVGQYPPDPRESVAVRDFARWHALWDRQRGGAVPQPPGCACGVPGLSCYFRERCT